MESTPFERFIRVYHKSEVIFTENSAGSEMFIISSGKVKLCTEPEPGQGITLAILKAGDYFGEMTLVDASPRSATAIAEEDNTRLIVLDKAKFLYLVRQQPEFAFSIMETLCQRIRETNLMLSRAKKASERRRKDG